MNFFRPSNRFVPQTPLINRQQQAGIDPFGLQQPIPKLVIPPKRPVDAPPMDFVAEYQKLIGDANRPNRLAYQQAIEQGPPQIQRSKWARLGTSLTSAAAALGGADVESAAKLGTDAYWAPQKRSDDLYNRRTAGLAHLAQFEDQDTDNAIKALQMKQKDYYDSRDYKLRESETTANVALAKARMDELDKDEWTDVDSGVKWVRDHPGQEPRKIGKVAQTPKEKSETDDAKSQRDFVEAYRLAALRGDYGLANTNSKNQAQVNIMKARIELELNKPNASEDYKSGILGYRNALVTDPDLSNYVKIAEDGSIVPKTANDFAFSPGHLSENFTGGVKLTKEEQDKIDTVTRALLTAPTKPNINIATPAPAVRPESANTIPSANASPATRPYPSTIPSTVNKTVTPDSPAEAPIPRLANGKVPIIDVEGGTTDVEVDEAKELLRIPNSPFKIDTKRANASGNVTPNIAPDTGEAPVFGPQSAPANGPLRGNPSLFPSITPRMSAGPAAPNVMPPVAPVNAPPVVPPPVAPSPVIPPPTINRFGNMNLGTRLGLTPPPNAPPTNIGNPLTVNGPTNIGTPLSIAGPPPGPARNISPAGAERMGPPPNLNVGPSNGLPANPIQLGQPPPDQFAPTNVGSNFNLGNLNGLTSGAPNAIAPRPMPAPIPGLNVPPNGPLPGGINPNAMRPPIAPARMISPGAAEMGNRPMPIPSLGNVPSNGPLPGAAGLTNAPLPENPIRISPPAGPARMISPAGAERNAPSPAVEFNSKLDTVIKRVEAATGMKIRRTSGTRTAEQQAKLYAQGRSTKGPIVTDADGTVMKSRHQTGQAVDLGFADKDGKPIRFTDKKGQLTKQGKKYYEMLGKIAKEEGLVWGGDWKGGKGKVGYDPMHVQLGGQ